VTAKTRKGWPLADRRLLLIVLPLLVFLAIYWLQFTWGLATHHLAQAVVADGNAEAAGRLRTLATFALFVAAAVAAIAYSVSLLVRLDSHSRLTIGTGYVLSMVVGITAVISVGAQKGDPYLERELPCTAFLLLSKTPEVPPDEYPLKPPPDPGRVSGTETCWATVFTAETPLAQRLTLIPCPRFPGDPFPILRALTAVSAVLLFFGIPAIVWGAIACLALPESGSARDRYEAWAGQTARLNRLLMITAGVMVASILFNDARYSWAGFSIHPNDLNTFKRQVSSLVFFAGVSSSILIASFYVPVASLLAAERPAASGSTGAKGGGENRVPDPFAAAKTAAAILAPALVGILGEMLKFGG
jgi:hypothetical protein